MGWRKVWHLHWNKFLKVTPNALIPLASTGKGFLCARLSQPFHLKNVVLRKQGFFNLEIIFTAI